MKPSTQLSLTIVSLLITSACDEHDPIDAELEAIEAHGEQGELDVLEPLANADETISTLTCDLDEQAEVGGLHYPNTTCADAIANAESTLGSWHYRNACNLKIGSDISSPAAAAVVTDCYLDPLDNAVVSVGLCCEPPPGPSCDADEQASVGGLHYPGLTCAEASLNAEASLDSGHYRKACNQQVGSDLASPVDEAFVTDCYVDKLDNAVVSVDLCCEPPPGPSSTLTCDLDEQVEVGGLHYPNTTCADAIANAESTLGSWHYRNACNLKIGCDISSPAAAAVVTDCYLDLSENVNAVVSVGLCCEPPPPPRIAYWQGKVNAHRDSGGTWLADPDCTSGAQIDPLVYCTQLYPATTSVTAVPLSTKPEHLWNTAGCGAQYSGNSEQEWTCNP